MMAMEEKTDKIEIFKREEDDENKKNKELIKINKYKKKIKKPSHINLIKNFQSRNKDNSIKNFQIEKNDNLIKNFQIVKNENFFDDNKLIKNNKNSKFENIIDLKKSKRTNEIVKNLNLNKLNQKLDKNENKKILGIYNIENILKNHNKNKKEKKNILTTFIIGKMEKQKIKVFYKQKNIWKIINIKIKKEKLVLDLKYKILEKIREKENIKKENLKPLDYILKIREEENFFKEKFLEEKEIDFLFDCDELEKISDFSNQIFILKKKIKKIIKLKNCENTNYLIFKQLVDPLNNFLIFIIKSKYLKILNSFLKFEKKKNLKVEEILNKIIYDKNIDSKNIIFYQEIKNYDQFFYEEINKKSFLKEIKGFKIKIEIKEFYDKKNIKKNDKKIKKKNIVFFKRKKLNKKKSIFYFLNFPGKIYINKIWKLVKISYKKKILLINYENFFDRIFYNPFYIEFKHIISCFPKINNKLIIFYNSFGIKKKIIIICFFVYDIAQKINHFKKNL